MLKRVFTLSALALGLGTTTVSGHEYGPPTLRIIHPMAFETAATAQAAAGYFAVVNRGEDDRLIGVRADFPRVMLHNIEETDGVAKMIHVDAVDLPAGEVTPLQPGGYHVMFMGLNGDPFEVGEEIPATLIFENAGEIDVVFNVEARKTEAEDHSDHSGHGTKAEKDDHSGHSGDHSGHGSKDASTKEHDHSQSD